MLRYGNLVIQTPELLYFLIPFVLLILFILRKRYIHEEQRLVHKKGRKRLIFFTRLLFCLFILLALSRPYVEENEILGNFTKVKALIDYSSSTKLYNIIAVEDTLKELSTQGVSVDVEKLEMNDESSIGSAVLNNIAPNDKILLVSDGQNNFGPELSDVSLFAASIDSKIFGINLEQKGYDASISIEGPTKVVSEVENDYKIRVREVGQPKNKNVKIFVDEKIEYEGKYDKEIILKKSFLSGNHILKAVVLPDEKDMFPENNIFYLTINVYKKLDVLFVSKQESPLAKVYAPFYNLDIKSELPDNLDKYYAVVLDDIDSKNLEDSDISNLDNFVSDGNGLFVIGGKNSYDWGNYNNSMLTNILPVSVGKANKKKDVVNIVILIDTGMSGINDKITGDLTKFDVQKSLTADIAKSVSSTNKLAILEANYFLNTITGLSEVGQKRAKVIEDIGFLKATGMSEVRFAYDQAHEMLRLSKGSKNIVIITDGKLTPLDERVTLTYVQQAYNDGIKTFIIGVGESGNESFFESVKEIGGGEFFRTDEKSKINLYFGDPSQNSNDDLKIFVYDSNHFITKGVKDIGNIYGYNTVYPKTNARMLLTTSTGDPVLTVWNYGLGRVASLSTDDSRAWVPDMAGKEGSVTLIKTLNWLIEDPERKNPMIIEAPPLRVNENAIITVKSAVIPKTNGLSFYEASEGIFKANIYPNQTGIIDLFGMPYAVNYKKEYLNLGLNDDFEKSLRISGGELIENDMRAIADKIKSVSSASTLKKIDLSWILIICAIIAYLAELFFRRLIEIKMQQ